MESLMLDCIAIYDILYIRAYVTDSDLCQDVLVQIMRRYF